MIRMNCKERYIKRHRDEINERMRYRYHSRKVLSKEVVDYCEGRLE